MIGNAFTLIARKIKICWDGHTNKLEVKLRRTIFAQRILEGNVSKLTWGQGVMWQIIFSLQHRAIRIIYSLDYKVCCRPSSINNNNLSFPSGYILECLIFIETNEENYKAHILS